MERMVGHEPADPGSNPGENKAGAMATRTQASARSATLPSCFQRCQPFNKAGDISRSIFYGKVQLYYPTQGVGRSLADLLHTARDIGPFWTFCPRLLGMRLLCVSRQWHSRWGGQLQPVLCREISKDWV